MADKYEIKTDILAPSDKKIIEYTGFHPTKIIKAMPELLKDVLKAGGGDVFEVVLKWDVSGDPTSFYAEWLAKSDFDLRSRAEFKIVAQGKQSAKDKMGNIKIALKGYVKTEFPNITFLHKSVVPIYMYTFYNKQRREYIDAGKIMLDRIEGEIRGMFNLIKRGG